MATETVCKAFYALVKHFTPKGHWPTGERRDHFRCL